MVGFIEAQLVHEGQAVGIAAAGCLYDLPPKAVSGDPIGIAGGLVNVAVRHPAGSNDRVAQITKLGDDGTATGEQYAALGGVEPDQLRRGWFKAV